MKKLLLLFILICVAYQNINVQNQNPSDLSDMVFIEKELADSLDISLRDWFRYFELDVDKFVLYKQQEVDLTILKNEYILTNYSDGEGVDYLPWLSAESPDDSTYTVVMSPVLGGEKEVNSLFYLVNPDQSCILLSRLDCNFFPSATSWLDNDKVLIAGQASYKEKEDFYFLEIIDIRNALSRLYLMSN